MEKKKSFSELLNACTTSLSSCKGGKKESIYLPSVYADCESTDDKKRVRKQIRNICEKFCTDIRKNKTNKEKLKTLKREFLDFYKLCYVNNDYTVSSVASKNTDAMQLEHYKEMFVILENVK